MGAQTPHGGAGIHGRLASPGDGVMRSPVPLDSAWAYDTHMCWSEQSESMRDLSQPSSHNLPKVFLTQFCL